MSIPENFQDILRDEAKAFAFLATSMEDGSPQVTPVWFSWDGKHILINSARGRVKDRNMRERPEIALAIVDPENPYRYIQVRGKVDEITMDGAVDHINQLSHKYHGRDYYAPGQAPEPRVIYRIAAEHISTMG